MARTLPAENRMLVTSEGFSQGIAQDAYYKTLAATKVAPCPSGPITVDSMRVCEALQLGAVPVIDSVSHQLARILNTGSVSLGMTIRYLTLVIRGNNSQSMLAISQSVGTHTLHSCFLGGRDIKPIYVDNSDAT